MLSICPKNHKIAVKRSMSLNSEMLISLISGYLTYCGDFDLLVNSLYYY